MVCLYEHSFGEETSYIIASFLCRQGRKLEVLRGICLFHGHVQNNKLLNPRHGPCRGFIPWQQRITGEVEVIVSGVVVHIISMLQMHREKDISQLNKKNYIESI